MSAGETTRRRRRKPLWRSELVLLGAVLVLAMVAGFVSRQDLGPVLGPALSILLLALALAAAVLLAVPLFRRGRADASTARESIAGLDLVRLPAELRVPVDDTRQRQIPIDAALARSGEELTAILTPGATTWWGRELRIAVDLVSDDGQVHRAGFLPRDVDALWSDRLLALAQHGAVAQVAARVRTATRPHGVDVFLGDIPGAD